MEITPRGEKYLRYWEAKKKSHANKYHEKNSIQKQAICFIYSNELWIRLFAEFYEKLPLLRNSSSYIYVGKDKCLRFTQGVNTTIDFQYNHIRNRNSQLKYDQFALLIISLLNCSQNAKRKKQPERTREREKLMNKTDNW